MVCLLGSPVRDFCKCLLGGAIVARLLVSAPAHAGALEEYFARIATAPLAAQIDARGTFRDLSFGTACSTVPGMAPVKDVGQFRVYGRSTDKLAVGTGTLKKIRYLCVGDAFRAVFLSFPEDSLPAIATAMVGTYGVPSSDESKRAYWRGLKRVAWLGRAEDKGDYLMTIGDLPWADPVALILMIRAANAQAGQTDL